MIDKKDRIYFRDVYDHLVRLHDINESMRDQVTGVLEIYLSVINNRMNEIMKTLTLITTIFMPISFLVGFLRHELLRPAGAVRRMDLAAVLRLHPVRPDSDAARLLHLVPPAQVAVGSTSARGKATRRFLPTTLPRF